MFIATLIAADILSQADISRAEDALADAGIAPKDSHWIEAAKAADIRFEDDLPGARAALTGTFAGIDAICQVESERAKSLLVADMDSTIITVECLDELAEYAGHKDAVSVITESAMRGELDFADALRERVSLLKDLEADLITRCHDDRIEISPGAVTLVKTMHAKKARCVLVSGGFRIFADRVAADIGFDRAVANMLEIAENRLTGRVADPIIDGAAKLATLKEEQAARQLSDVQVLAIGDGANDLAMIRAAGLGVAYRGKPKLRAAADACLDHNDLSALLYAQGYPRCDWMTR